MDIERDFMLECFTDIPKFKLTLTGHGFSRYALGAKENFAVSVECIYGKY